MSDETKGLAILLALVALVAAACVLVFRHETAADARRYRDFTADCRTSGAQLLEVGDIAVCMFDGNVLAKRRR